MSKMAFLTCLLFPFSRMLPPTEPRAALGRATPERRAGPAGPPPRRQNRLTMMTTTMMTRRKRMKMTTMRMTTKWFLCLRM